jgi:hypothetical protein
MRAIWILLLTLALFVPACATNKTTGNVVKVLPFHLDREGRIAKSPSLFDRDAYQAYLRLHTNEISGVRYDVLWSAKNTGTNTLKVRVELRGFATSKIPSFKTLETEVKPGFFRTWTELRLAGNEFIQFGSVTAWRATLWEGDTQLAEQKSFLW